MIYRVTVKTIMSTDIIKYKLPGRGSLTTSSSWEQVDWDVQGRESITWRQGGCEFVGNSSQKHLTRHDTFTLDTFLILRICHILWTEDQGMLLAKDWKILFFIIYGIFNDKHNILDTT